MHLYNALLILQQSAVDDGGDVQCRSCVLVIDVDCASQSVECNLAPAATVLYCALVRHVHIMIDCFNIRYGHKSSATS